MTSSGIKPGVLLQLRESTRHAHQRLEATLNLLDERMNREDYTKILAQFHGFWRGWQPLVSRLIDEPALTTPRRRLHMLANDLSAMGMSQAEIDGLPACPMPELQNPAAALGSLYVMEGSTLGGRIIEKNLNSRLGTAPGFAISYFAGYGARTGEMWRDFCDRLDAAPLSAAAPIIDGANATFACLTSWFARA